LIYFEQGEHNKAIDLLFDALKELPKNADLHYRLTVYMLDAGRVKEAFNSLETALILNFDGHTAIFDFFPKPEAQKALYKIINQFRKTN